MSAYRDRVGQRIGSLEVLADLGKRTKRGKVLWLCHDHDTGEQKVYRTEQLIRLDRKQGEAA